MTSKQILIFSSVTEIEGSEEAILFKKILKSAQEKEVYNIGEFGIGLNPK
ncbi:unnamed protein product, partial [marine sediment metagenome]